MADEEDGRRSSRDNKGILIPGSLVVSLQLPTSTNSIGLRMEEFDS